LAGKKESREPLNREKIERTFRKSKGFQAFPTSNHEESLADKER